MLGELADAVLVAGRGTDLDDPAGLITVSLAGGEGSIGLIAVDRISTWTRGRMKLDPGCGTRWLLGRDARTVKVVTQLDNRKACSLYEKCGYAHAELLHVYHFWP